MPGFVGFPELLLLGLVALLLFGPKRLPEMGRGLGKGLREFKDSISGDDEDRRKLRRRPRRPCTRSTSRPTCPPTRRPSRRFSPSATRSP